MSDRFHSSYKRRTVSLCDDVYERLKAKGRFGESFSDLVARLLEELTVRNGGKAAS